jgi:hypothetical protein
MTGGMHGVGSGPGVANGSITGGHGSQIGGAIGWQTPVGAKAPPHVLPNGAKALL